MTNAKRLCFLSLVALIATVCLGCAGTLEETRGALRVSRLAGVQVAPSAQCSSLSSKERIWTGVAVGGAILAGASGLATFPVTSKTGEQILAGATIGASLGAGVGVVEQQAYAREWQRSGCDQ